MSGAMVKGRGGAQFCRCWHLAAERRATVIDGIEALQKTVVVSTFILYTPNLKIKMPAAGPNIRPRFPQAPYPLTSTSEK